MHLYHGTNIRFDDIDLTKSLPGKDFGQGFYLSDNYEQAATLANMKFSRLGGDEIVQEYEFDDALLVSNDLKVKNFTGYTKDWAEFIFTNRRNETSHNLHNYDIVIGPIANDRVGLQILRYMEGDIDFNTFLNKLKYMKGITIQYFFGTEKAISKLKRIR